MILKEKLIKNKNEIKWIGAHLAEKEIMYAQQRTFEFMEKPGQGYQQKETPQKNLNMSVRRVDGSTTDEPQQKLQIFSDYYQGLYSVEHAAIGELDKLTFWFSCSFIVE